MARFFCWVLLLAVSGSVLAEDLYVSQSGAGAQSGADCASAHSVSWFNTSGNWGAGAGKISQGDTVHLCGTITSTLTVQSDGANGAPITIIYEVGSKSSAPLWGPDVTQAAVYVGAHPWIVVDSAVRQVNIECTNNGTVLGLQDFSNGVYLLQGADNCTVQNLTITNMYKNFGHADITGFGQCIAAESANNLTISNNIISDAATILGYSYAGSACSNLTIVGNSILVGNHGLTIGTEIGFLHDVLVHRNRFDRFDEWDVEASGRHLDAVIVFNNSTNTLCTLSNITFSANTFGPNTGTNNTAAIFLNGYHTEHFKNVFIYNNVFGITNGQTWNNGCIAAEGTNILIANNTFWSFGFGQSQAIKVGGTVSGTFPSGPFYSAGIRAVNNLMYQIGTEINEGVLTAAYDVTPFFSDTNIYSALAVGTGTFYITNNGATTFGGWKFFYPSLDAGSTTNLASLDANFVPQSGDATAKDKGADLSAFFTTDKNGVTRGNGSTTGTKWDIGAFEFVSGCSYSLDVSSASANAAGTITSGSATIAVTAGAGCSWTGVANDSWLHVTSGSSGVGNGSVTFIVDLNSGGSRSGTLTVAGYTFTVSQSGAAVVLPVTARGGVMFRPGVVIRK